MSRFPGKLEVELVDDDENEGRGSWRLTAPFVYESDIAGVITVPAGFVTDFASVPRVPIAFWLTGDTAHDAAVIHDYLYSTGQVQRATADAVLLEAAELTGVPAWRRYAMYYAVRAFGGSHYGPKDSPTTATERNAPTA
ncbi:MAG: hypothetical protein A2Y38_19855 [Spirochaetes bacterium GWB1_59_5]|nr:MAG: hypothetical protein A2Y38_19855 [Spirochaetes bacterium GWB1_59_5]